MVIKPNLYFMFFFVRDPICYLTRLDFKKRDFRTWANEKGNGSKIWIWSKSHLHFFEILEPSQLLYFKLQLLQNMKFQFLTNSSFSSGTRFLSPGDASQRFLTSGDPSSRYLSELDGAPNGHCGKRSMSESHPREIEVFIEDDGSYRTAAALVRN